MKYLFDTDILSNVVKKQPSKLLLAKLSTLPADDQFTTAINMGEIYYGASRAAHGPQILKAFQDKVFPALTVLAFDAESAVIYGVLKAELESKGISRSEPDLRIAAIALQHRLVLVTGNSVHFKAIPKLKVENWLGDKRAIKKQSEEA